MKAKLFSLQTISIIILFSVFLALFIDLAYTNKSANANNNRSSLLALNSTNQKNQVIKSGDSSIKALCYNAGTRGVSQYGSLGHWRQYCDTFAQSLTLYGSQQVEDCINSCEQAVRDSGGHEWP